MTKLFERSALVIEILGVTELSIRNERNRPKIQHEKYNIILEYSNRNKLSVLFLKCVYLSYTTFLDFD